LNLIGFISANGLNRELRQQNEEKKTKREENEVGEMLLSDYGGEDSDEASEGLE